MRSPKPEVTGPGTGRERKPLVLQVVVPLRIARIRASRASRASSVWIRASSASAVFSLRRSARVAARASLNAVAGVATDPDRDVAADAPLVTELEGLVEGLLGNFDRDLSTFDQALARLEDLATREADRRAERLSQVTREAERQEALATATLTARGLLADRIENDTPEFVREFLDQWWAPAIALAGQAGEGAPIRAADALQVAEALIWRRSLSL